MEILNEEQKNTMVEWSTSMKELSKRILDMMQRSGLPAQPEDSTVTDEPPCSDLAEVLDWAMRDRAETLKESRAAQKRDQEAWAKVLEIIKPLELEDGHTIIGEWVVSKNTNPLMCGFGDQYSVSPRKSIEPNT